MSEPIQVAAYRQRCMYCALQRANAIAPKIVKGT